MNRLLNSYRGPAVDRAEPAHVNGYKCNHWRLQVIATNQPFRGVGPLCC